jgi:predicted PurR-regulated permease PerM
MVNAANAQVGQITRWVLIAFGIIIVGLAVWISRDVLMLTLSAAILAMVITTPVKFLVRFGVRRSMAIVLSLILMLILLVLIVALLLPGLLDQFRQLVNILSRAFTFTTYTLSTPRLDETDLTVVLRRAMQATNSTSILDNLDFLKGLDISGISKELTTQVFTSLSSIPSQVFPFVGGVASLLLSLLIVFFMSIYFVADPDSYQRGMIRLVPRFYRVRAKDIIDRIEQSLRRFLQVQAVIMLLTGTSTGLALFFMGIPLAGALGTITFLFSFVPNFGPLVALIPILGVVIINAPAKILIVVAVFYALQLLINQFIAPLMVGQEVNIPPVVIILAQVLAGVFFGFLGLLLSVPLAAIAVVLIREIYIKDILGDRDLDRTGQHDAVPVAPVIKPDPQPSQPERA